MNKMNLLTTKNMYANAKMIKKINPKELGYICPNGIINFQTEENALKYAKNMIVRTLKTEGKELAVITNGSRVLKSFPGDKDAVKMVLEDLPDIKGCVHHHGHPGFYKGITSPFSLGDAKSFLLLNKILGYNKYFVYNQLGEECCMEFKPSKVLRKLPATLRYLLCMTSPSIQNKLRAIDKAEQKISKGASLENYIGRMFKNKQEIKQSFDEAENGGEKGQNEFMNLLNAKFNSLLHHDIIMDYAPKIGADYKTNFSYLVK